MYPFLGFLLILFLVLFVIHSFRRKKIIKKFKHMNCKEKCETLEALITPFGYSYDKEQDAFTSTLNPWQREFGYGQIYDRLAPHFNMIFDALPVYFDYGGQTWLIEFWKGQYGINIGGEIGIYKANKLLDKIQRKFEIFEAVSDKELLPMSLKLHKIDLQYDSQTNRSYLSSGENLAHFSHLHWWLTGFKMGCYTEPRQLSMEVSLTFPDCDMLNAFTDGLSLSPLHPDTIYINGLTVSFSFHSCSTCSYGFFQKHYTNYVQWKNRCLCKLFLALTKPFTLSMDRILYLYEYAPFVFRKMFTIHHYKRLSKKKYHYSSGNRPTSHQKPCLKNRYFANRHRR